MKKVVVVIPTHNQNPMTSELASFTQCYKILGEHPIRILAPEGLDVSAYTHVVPECQVVFIDKNWLSSIEQYNKLKINPYFYHLFKEYNYLLTYELDAWVFRDELLYWCEKDYDYIGAPWFEDWYKANKSLKPIGVGNSGFSLRSVPKALQVLTRVQRIKRLRKFWFSSKLQSILRFTNLLKKFKFIQPQCDFVRLPEILWDHYQYNEDLFWGIIVPSVFNDFKIGDINEATKFSFEVNPSFLFAQSENKLPFGCHAWEKFEPEFWNKYIEVND